MAAKAKTKSRRPIKNRLATLRAQFRGPLKQRHVALILGLDETTVARHEAGSRGLNKKLIEGYCDLYGVQSHELFLAPEEVTGPDGD